MEEHKNFVQNKQRQKQKQNKKRQKKVLFQDKDVKITDQDVQIKWYFFPIGTSKVIPYSKIKKVQVRPLGKAASWRLWGMDATQWGYWLPGDKNRPQRNQFIAVYTESSITPSFTTANINVAYQIIEDQLQKHRHSN